MTPPAIERRAATLDRLERESFDLLVVGGGITGAGALLDAASRGLRAALVERDDLAVGTSSRSSKLIHGGLRYLEQFRFNLVFEALAERRRLLRLAPHLVRLERFVVPIHGSPLRMPYIGAGMVLYDLLGASRDGGRFRALLPGTVRRLAPTVRAKKLRGGFVYHDGIVDDARLVSAVVRTAEDLGALAATRAEAIELLRDGGRATGSRVRDRLSGARSTSGPPRSSTQRVSRRGRRVRSPMPVPPSTGAPAPRPGRAAASISSCAAIVCRWRRA